MKSPVHPPFSHCRSHMKMEASDSAALRSVNGLNIGGLSVQGGFNPGEELLKRTWVLGSTHSGLNPGAFSRLCDLGQVTCASEPQLLFSSQELSMLVVVASSPWWATYERTQSHACCRVREKPGVLALEESLRELPARVKMSSQCGGITQGCYIGRSCVAAPAVTKAELSTSIKLSSSPHVMEC